MSEKKMGEKYYVDVLNAILEDGYDLIVVVDVFGMITMMSKGYKDFLGIENPEGKHVTKVIENTHLHEVVKTGKPEVGEIQYINNKPTIAVRLPLFNKGKIIGAMGKVMFKDIKDLYALTSKMKNMESEIEYYREQLIKERGAKYSFENIVGVSEKLTATKNMAKRASASDSNVLILGESGTGKELFAHSIHNASKRGAGPFVKINCAAIPAELLESELFGYEGGAFTGARKEGKIGKFEMANKGSIFLDEIGDMPLQMQVKLLRVLQEREIERVGATKTKKIDVRVIAATNKNLESLVREGEFRKDLYYRLNVMTLSIDPLRSRKEDIEPLADFFIKKLSDEMGRYVKYITPEAMKYLKEYDWPGNIRELENIIERAINLLDSDMVIKPIHIPTKIIQGTYKGNSTGEARVLKDILENVEKEVILQTLKENEGNKQKTAKDLSISRTSLYQKLKQYGVEDV